MWWPITVLSIGFLLRLYRLGYQSIWYDEGVSLYLAGQAPGQLIHHTAGDIHPPFYYLLLSFWTHLAGRAEFSVAFLSVFFGILIIAAAYHIGSHLYDRKVGVVTACLIAVSPYQIWYSQEIRMYTLGASLGLIAFWGAWNLLEEPSQNKSRYDTGFHMYAYETTAAGKMPAPQWFHKRKVIPYGVLYVIGGALGLYTLYYFAFLLVAFNVWAVIQLMRRRRNGIPARSDTVRWFTAQVAVLILYGPWLGVALRQVLNPPVPPWRSATPLWSIIVQSWSALSFGQSVIPAQVIYALLLTVAIYVLGAVVTFRRNANQGIALILYTLCPVALIVLASLWTPLFHVRYVFTYSPAFYLVLAAGFVWLLRRAPLVGSLIAIVWLAVTGYSIYEFHYNPRYSSDDFRGAVQHIAENIRPGDAILINAGYAYTTFVYYYPEEIAWRGRLVNYEPALDLTQGTIVLQTGSINGPPDLGWRHPDSDFYATDEPQTAQALTRMFETHPRLWMLRAYDTVVDPDGFIRSWLDEQGFLFEDRTFAGESYIRVRGYLTRKEPVLETPPLSESPHVTFGDGLRLLGYVSEGDAVQPGHPWDSDLYWSVLKRLPSDYRVIVELADEDDQPWARSDEMPLGTAYPTSQWQEDEILRQPVRLHVPQDIPSGRYEVRVMVYDPKRQEALSAMAPQGQLPAGKITLGAVTVVN